MRAILLSNPNRLRGAQAGTLSQSRVASPSLHFEADKRQRIKVSLYWSFFPVPITFLRGRLCAVSLPQGRFCLPSAAVSLLQGSPTSGAVGHRRDDRKFSLVRETTKVRQIKITKAPDHPEGRPSTVETRTIHGTAVACKARANSLKNLQ